VVHRPEELNVIGGDDIIITSSLPGLEALAELISVTDKIWPNRVVEIVEDTTTEALVYENLEAKQSWDSDGMTEENDPKMLHLLASEGQATIVCSSRDHKHAKEYLAWVMTIKHPSGVGFAFGIRK
jgi:hypothetical protein